MQTDAREPRKAVVTGVSGQDGYFMGLLLQARGIEVIGLARDPASCKAQFDVAGFERFTFEAFDYARPDAFSDVVRRHQPDLVFNFAAKATGQGMFDAPAEMARLNGTFVLDILEAIRTSPDRERIGFCQASSSEMFGAAVETPQSERTPFRPRSPYGAAKLYAHHMIGIYRAAYGMRCSSAILYNHESIRRSTQFVTRKIANGAVRIKLGFADQLPLGPLETARDWGYAPEYVEAMYLMATAPQPADYVVATGRLNTVRRLCEIAFGHLGLNYMDYVRANVGEVRLASSLNLLGDPSQIERDLGWRAKRPIEDIMVELVDHEMTQLSGREARA